MDIFISWSGTASQAIATSLDTNLPRIIQALKPFMSAHSIDAGERWPPRIAAELEQSNFGLLCLTKTNTCAPWILFEAGALSKALDKARVVPIMCGIQPSNLSPPLTHFQGIPFEKENIFSLLEMINNALGDQKLRHDDLAESFQHRWPTLEKEVLDALRSPEQETATPEYDLPKIGQMMEELLTLTRGLRREREIEVLEDDVGQAALNLYSRVSDENLKSTLGQIIRDRNRILHMTKTMERPAPSGGIGARPKTDNDHAEPGARDETADERKPKGDKPTED